MGEAASKWVQRFDWSRVGNQWIDYLDGLEKRILPKKYTWKPIKNEGVGKEIQSKEDSNRPSNLAVACDSCNQRKNAKMPERLGY
jgi:hypothetical protein